MVSIPFINELNKLKLPKDQFAIFGSSLLHVRKIRKANDLDILVTKDLFDTLSKQYPDHVTSDTHMQIGHIEIMNTRHTMESKTPHMIKTAKKIFDHPFVQRKYLLESKRNMQRPKDIFDIHLIIKHLRKHLNRLRFLHIQKNCGDFLANLK